MTEYPMKDYDRLYADNLTLLKRLEEKEQQLAEAQQRLATLETAWDKVASHLWIKGATIDTIIDHLLSVARVWKAEGLKQLQQKTSPQAQPEEQHPGP